MRSKIRNVLVGRASARGSLTDERFSESVKDVDVQIFRSLECLFMEGFTVQNISVRIDENEWKTVSK